MLQTTRPSKAVKAFEVSQGGDKMEYLLAASLAVVIVGALVLTVYFTFFRSSKAAAGPAKHMWQCQRCGTEIAVDDMTQNALEEMDKPVTDCPKCGSPQPVWPMVKCFNPACGRYFVPQHVKDRRKSLADDTCPYCGKNWAKGLDEQTARGRTK